MKFKAMTRFIKKFIISLIFMSIMNLFILGGFIFSHVQQTNSIDTVKQLVKQIDIKSDSIEISKSGKRLANTKKVWIMILDANTGHEIYQYRKPSEIPNKYNLADVVKFTRYYLNDYPVFTQIIGDKIEVFGFSKTEVFRFPFDYYEKSDLHNVIILAILLLIINCLYLLAIYTYSTKFISRKLTPLALAIKNLPQGLHKAVPSQDELQQLTDAINIVDKKLKDEERFKENWISGIAHDIKTPLSVIISNASLISDDTDNSDQKRHLRSIINESYYIQNIVNDLNIFARLKNTKFFLNLDSVKIISFFKEIIIQIINQGIWENSNFEFNYDHSLIGHTITVEKNLISRVIHNIIYNSVLHNQNGCNISIYLEKKDSFLVVIIEDNGIGVTIDKLNRLYEEEITEFDISGIRRHGIGLKISKQIIEVHNGTMKIQSKENQFFRTIIELPLDTK
ncbi:ATPase/histidine kinase/DNA gyrase B/HSP90 domain protein [Streptococcus macacae NCTC 11558]|uniref:histidine kinase n=1 Tax=Streptococcus macacae NCTC 11558 TaxID=764298 RepID=G5JV74_9STRE|nr:ATPase/histidine kinase/DNA gyrase B/HSP90 domain protein [Streptococcus macacae NCTC 11558]